MKLFISLSLALSIGFFSFCFLRWIPTLSRPKPNDLTRGVRQLMDRLLETRQPWVVRYKQRLILLLSETPLPMPMDVPLFIGVQCLAGGLVWIWCLCASPSFAFIALPLCFSLGAGLVYIWLVQQQKKFHTELLKALPGCLELLAVVMECGLDLSAGLQQYALKGPQGPLRNLLKETQNDVHMGLSRSEAFSRLGKRTSFGPLRDVSRGIVQGLLLGTGLGPFLTRQAQALRTRRMHLAEKKAAEAPLKILFPLFVFIFPTIFIVLLGPLVLLFSRGEF